MLRSLLVSDLDGTLLDSNKHVSALSARILNKFISCGGLFTVATARMVYGCEDRLSELDLQLPWIVMNCAALYSPLTRTYEHCFSVDPAKVEQLATIIEQTQAGAFIYAINEGHLVIGHARNRDLEWTQYNSRAAREADVPISNMGYGNWSALGNVVYCAVVGTKEQLASIAMSVLQVSGLRAFPYKNVYSNTECLEIASSAAGKENAVRLLSLGLGAQELIVFGDNYNDLEMMRMADIALAPQGAEPEAVAEAHRTIESNDDDGEAREIERLFL